MLAGNAYQSSSTDIRLSLHGGVDPSQLPADVAAYIREKRLYQ
jgi:nicotinic acid mononucleotide adenylyltransferase